MLRRKIPIETEQERPENKNAVYANNPGALNWAFNPPKMGRGRMPKPEEHKTYLKSIRRCNLERLAAIAHDRLYREYYAEDGVTLLRRERVEVPVQVQEQALGQLLDRDIGKAKLSVDVSSGGRPIVFDPAFAEQLPDNTPTELEPEDVEVMPDE